jgi:hypothetical protein
MTDTTIQKRNMELSNTESQEIEKVFSEARDFRSV